MGILAEWGEVEEGAVTAAGGTYPGETCSPSYYHSRPAVAVAVAVVAAAVVVYVRGKTDRKAVDTLVVASAYCFA